MTSGDRGLGEKLRGWLAGSARRYQAGFWTFIVLSALAIAALIEGQPIAVVVIAFAALAVGVVVGLVHIPGSRSAYFARAGQPFRDWVYADVIYGASDDGVRDEFIRKLGASRPPPRFAERHQQILDLVGKTREDRRADLIPLADRAATAVEQTAHFRSLFSEMEASVSNQPEAAYLQSLNKWRKAWKQANTKRRLHEERQAQRTLKRLDRISAPEDLRAAHHVLTQAVNRYSADMCEFHSAVSSLEPEATRATANKLERSCKVLQEKVAQLWTDWRAFRGLERGRAMEPVFRGDTAETKR